MRIAAIVTLCTSPLLAQSAGVPRLGWIPADPPGRLREVVGLPGAAQLGPPLSFGAARILSIRPDRNIAVALRPDGTVGILHLRPGVPDAAWQTLEGAVHDADVAAWSPLGHVLALGSVAEGRLQVWHIEVEDTPKLAYELPVTAGRAAVSDAGSVLAAMDGALYRVSADGAMQLVSPHVSGAVTFLAGSDRFAWVEDSGVWMQGRDGPPVRIVLPEGASTNGILLASARGAPLLAAAPGPKETILASWNEHGEPVGQWRCPVSALGLAPSGQQGVFQLVTARTGPVWMAAFGDTGGRVFFVPARVEEGQQQ